MPAIHRPSRTIPTALFACLSLAACDTDKDRSMQQPKAPAPPAVTGAVTEAAPAPAGVTVDPAVKALFAKLPAAVPGADGSPTKAQMALGRQLYFDARMSKNHDVSCNTCHLLDKYGVDSLNVSLGHRKQKGGRNAPTVYNAAGHIAQFWDGRAADVEEQAKGPPLNPVEMAMKDAAAIEAVLNSMPEYVAAFRAAFPDDKAPVSYDNFGKAIGAFERRLMTPGRFDAFLGGDSAALTDAEKEGMKLFAATGCTACHAGTYVGGNSYQKLGMVKPWPNTADKGRSEVTGNAADEMFFKVPSLRNIEKTAPYFHDASAKTLEDAVAKMAEHQLGKTLSEAEVGSIVTFLNALTGELPTDYIQPPELPASTDSTPKPDPN